MSSIEQRSISAPDDKMEYPDSMGGVEHMHVGGATISHVRCKPGFRWTTHHKAAAGTDTCQKRHTGYVIAGKMTVKMDDGKQATFSAGDAFCIPPGHDAWVEGSEECEMVDFAGNVSTS